MNEEEQIQIPSSDSTANWSRFRRLWVLATTLGWIVGVGLGLLVFAASVSVRGEFEHLVTSLLTALAMAIAGTVAGAGQWLVSRRQIPHAGRWLWATVRAWILAGCLGSLAYELVLWMFDGSGRSWALAGAGLCLVAAGAMVGVSEWLGLRNRSWLRSWLWANAVGWALCLVLLLAAAVLFVAGQEYFPLFGNIAAPLGLVAGGALVGGITARPIADLLRQPVQVDAALRPVRRRVTLAWVLLWFLLMIVTTGSLLRLVGPPRLYIWLYLPSGCPPDCASADLAGADLVDADLRGANLTGADLHEANLMRADLRGADLRGADLRGADLWQAHLQGAKLDDATQIDAKWRLVWIIYQEGAANRDLRGADLSGARLAGPTILSGANLHGANLHDTVLWGSSLQGADLGEADLSEANVDGANLNGANLTGADLTGAEVRSSRLNGATLISADLTQADLTGAKLRRADLSNACLSGADLSGADLSGANLEGAEVTPEQLARAASLKGATMPDGMVHE